MGGVPKDQRRALVLPGADGWTEIVTWVPCPGALLIVTSAPIKAARSRVLASPW